MQSFNATLLKEINRVHSGEPWVHLFRIILSSTTPLKALYITNHDKKVEWGLEGSPSETTEYQPIAMLISEVESDSEGNLNEIQLSVSNITTQAGVELETFDGLRGNEVRWRIINLNALSISADFPEETYQIVESNYNYESATITLGHFNLLERLVPSNRYIRDRCRYIYKDANTCSYTGGLATCDKTLSGTNGCGVHNNTIRFGGFPGIPAGPIRV